MGPRNGPRRAGAVHRGKSRHRAAVTIIGNREDRHNEYNRRGQDEVVSAGCGHVSMRDAASVRTGRYYISALDCSVSQASNALRRMRLYCGWYPGMLE